MLADYRRDRLFTVRSLWTSLGFYFFMLFSTSAVAPVMGEEFSPFALSVLYLGYSLTHFTISLFLKVHQMFILSIRTRYKIINNLMRFDFLVVFFFISLFPLQFICFFFFCSLRKHLLRNRSSIQMVQTVDFNVITFIKTLGRLHDKLGELMNNVNFCYSFQVKLIFL